MGDINQKIYLKRFVPDISGAILEVGSKDYGNTSSFKDYYKENEYVGIDMEEGPGVDSVLDLTLGTGDLNEGHFSLCICCSVLEHVRKPWVMAENITRLIRGSGKLYMSIPWVWRYHPYPDDYYRFSWKGVIELFPDFDWDHVFYSTNVANEFFEITEDSYEIDNKQAIKKRTLRGKRKYLPYLMVNMLGTKR